MLNQLLIKLKNKKNLIFYFLIPFILLFFDLFLSNLFNIQRIDKNCIDLKLHNVKEKKYFFFELKKNCLAYINIPYNKPYKIYTDNYSLRTQKNKKKYQENIIILGDSFSFGFGLNYEESIVGRLEKKLRYNIFNLSLFGDTTSVSKYRLKKFLEKNDNLKFNKIIYFLDLSDVFQETNTIYHFNQLDYPTTNSIFFEDYKEDKYKIYHEFRILRKTAYEINHKIRRILYDLSFSKKKYSRILETTFASFTYKNWNDLDSVWTQKPNKGILAIEKFIREISDLAKKKDAEFILVIYPWPQTLMYGESEFSWQHFAEKLCKVSNCNQLINIFQEFQSLNKSDKEFILNAYLKNDPHFSSYGSRIFSELLFKNILKGYK